MEAERVNAKASGSGRTIAASLAALGSAVLASSCCLPMFPFIFAAGAAGSSAFFVKIRPFLLALSLLSIGFAFYQRWRAKKCNCKPNLLSTIILWFSVVVVLTFFLFPHLIANLVANFLAG
jgi:mercuric ion transport protein